MQEIKCPHCGKVCQVDESGYDQIVRQVRDREFEKELARREQEMERTREHDRSLERMEREIRDFAEFKIHSLIKERSADNG